MDAPLTLLMSVVKVRSSRLNFLSFLSLVRDPMKEFLKLLRSKMDCWVLQVFERIFWMSRMELWLVLLAMLRNSKFVYG
jgi:hypothetical protein